ncbi:MAG TPA: xanthine dehydrogenase family protein molybdopterin-binding subunit [Rhizomicrobium sp.]|jgi:xanthine dehydrogenase YagR molybdenum-binding subunit|nr:xanthine dehydrogenase family protein molybdopterin-binding subunit [Rhizomicrobium sp.]
MAAIGIAHVRLDGPAKVTGEAHYGSDVPLNKPAFGVLVTSAIAKGRIANIDERETRALPGVIGVFTHRNIGKIEAGKTFDGGGYMGTSIAPLASDRIFHDGQIVALVVADTFETARDGAHRLTIDYVAEAPSATFDSDGTKTVAGAKASKKHKDPSVGDAAAAYATAPVKIEAEYLTATEHHNPIELFTTACSWSGKRLTVWESSQNMWGFKNGLAQQLGIAVEDIHVISPFVGGAFGSRGSLTQRTAIVARAAKLIGRPVKLMTTRDQGFTIATYRAETRHHIKLGATADGKLVSLTHEGEEVTSRADNYMVAGTDASTRVYACPNVASKVSIVYADRNTPGFMRSPPETPYIFALECAMDELSYALKIDPVRLRRINDTKNEPIKGLPYTSRSLLECFDAGTKAFGWEKRSPEPRSMRDGDWLVGMGTATTLYPSNIAPATARVTLYPDGTAKVQTATHEIGQGVYTLCALIAADKLGIDPDKVSVELGDSTLPPAPVAGGSNSSASVGNAVAKACDMILARQKEGANGAIEAYAENTPPGAPDDGIKKLYHGQPSFVGGAMGKTDIRFAFGAQFVEVRVHARTGEIRVPRAAGAFAAGRIINPKTAKSQLMGGMIWGISAALHEATQIDRGAARYTNKDLAEYMIPVNADIGDIEVIMLPEQDMVVNPLGIKGIGELGNVGMNAAVVNAVFHATGKRVRHMPVRIEDIL